MTPLKRWSRNHTLATVYPMFYKASNHRRNSSTGPNPHILVWRINVSRSSLGPSCPWLTDGSVFPDGKCCCQCNASVPPPVVDINL